MYKTIMRPTYSDREMRTVTIDSEPWFVAADVTNTGQTGMQDARIIDDFYDAHAYSNAERAA
ncbi:hypothetical protein ATY41_05235 [Leifsonia xyli subsp. xyli]|uniref:Bro-N domain-containing protein n=1 Tax=Leifsonia xyli subsp. xyli TaxID=59736 RepID=A0A1E2SHZ6_LEIXY|nr:hypothetical protein [Leifsonia xyli]ODA89495.1 hypothetical protein ATY41_05235 [Leifsonia xyli subsp. xyli]